MKSLGALLFLGLVSVAASAGEKLTYSEVERLPVPRLAERALGEAGKLMMDVERPRNSLRRADLKFFSHAYTTGSQYGVCASDWVTLSFDENGSLAALQSERRYGIEGSIYTDPKNWTYEEYATLCARVKSTRRYFPAPDAQSALTVSAYVDFLAEKNTTTAPTYSYECSGSCAKIDGKSYIKDIQLTNITQVEAIDCHQTKIYNKCYRLTLDGQPHGLFPRVLTIYGRMQKSNVEVTDVRLWVGETYN